MGRRWDKVRSWWRGGGDGAKSYLVQLEVGEDGFIPVALSWGGTNLTKVYTQAVWTYICCKRIADDVANFTPVVQVRDSGSSAWKNDPDHDLNEVLLHPYGTSPGVSRWHWQQQIGTGTLRQELDGNQFYRLETAGERMLMLALYMVQLKANEDENKQFTTYSPLGSAERIPVEKVVNVQTDNPGSWWRGAPASLANEQAQRVDYATSLRMRWDMEHRVQPGAVFKVKGIFTVSDEQYTATKKKIDESWEGAANAGKSILVGDDTEVLNAPAPQVADIPEIGRYARDVVVSSYQVVPLMVGIGGEKAKVVDLDKAQRAQFTGCVGPRLNKIYHTLNVQGVWQAYPDRRVRLWYDLVSSPLGLAYLREKADTARRYYDMGWPAMHVDERFGLEMSEFDGWDRAQMNAVIAGRVPGEGSGDPAPEDEGLDDEADDGDE